MRGVKILVVAACVLIHPVLASGADIAIQELEAKAKVGDVASQLTLAGMYDTGNGVRKSAKEAEKWYRMAADAGNSEAQNSVGSLLQDKRKYGEARLWYEKAAAQSHPQAINNLGFLYDLGLGVAQDREEGKALYLAAAKLGWGEAMWNLANMAALGQAGPVDWFEACIWTSRALNSAQIGYRDLQARAERGMQEINMRLRGADLDRCKQEASNPP